ncbi:DUF4214 domain-containing protein [Cellulomonas cellasea]|uniref:DUF4214 domain-containing protein n=1 Tax=Cellulomonas cellasea TaxID=43670 RepID=A0A7W4YCL1_9CELL|nr:DUF4214 domain-containing protein [Cellulomonas cellasea]MBB2923636.1 hypothetical protein [Cellulomonas cellasea]
MAAVAVAALGALGSVPVAAAQAPSLAPPPTVAGASPVSVAAPVAAVPVPAAAAPAAAEPPAGRDLPSDAPEHRGRLRALAAGTQLTFDEAAREARLRVDEGGSLDQYLYGPGPITFDIDLEGIDPQAAGGQPIELRMWVFDVDQAGGGECGPEVDTVSVNGTRVGTLTGADSQWIVNTFSVPPGVLGSGSNAFRVDIDTAGTGCWAVEVDWAEVTVPFAIAHLATDATDDVDVLRGLSEDEIPDTVFERAFQSDGTLGAPTKVDVIADAMSDQPWFGGPTAGTFTYEYTIDAWPSRPDWEPTVRPRWEFSGGGGAGSGPPAGISGWEDEVEITLPQRTGVYDLTVWLELRKGETLLTVQEQKHTVYVLLGEPVSSWRPGLPSTGTPKTGWLDFAFDRGAAGKATAEDVALALNSGVYGNPKGWTYWGDFRTLDSAQALIEGTGTLGQCTTFRDVWVTLARSVGVDASYESSPQYNFLTHTRPALDGNANANTAPTGGGAADRWLFGSHSWGTYAGKRYDPTFGVTGDAGTAAFERDSVACKVGGAIGPSVYRCTPIGGGPVDFEVTPLGTTKAEWPQNTYRTIPPAPAPAPLAPAPAPPGPAPQEDDAAVQALAVATDRGEDTDGNGQFEHLRLDLPVVVPAAGEHLVDLALSAPDGTYLARGTLDPAGDVNVVVHATLPAGESVVPVFFPGEVLRASGVDGPYTVTGTVAAADGTLVASVGLTTQAYDATAFQGPLAEVGAITDAVEGGGLRVRVPVTATGSGVASVGAQLFAGGTQVGAARQDLTLVAGAVQDVLLDLDGAPVWALGVDGPYTVFLTVEDLTSARTLTHTTAAYDADDFAPPPVHVGAEVTDAGTDADGDGRFDTLDVTAAVAALTAGDVTVHGALVAPDGTSIDTVTTTVSATTAPQDVTLRFAGPDVALAGHDGPYDVALAVSDAAGVPQMTRVHRTAPYTAAQFDPPAASLTGTYADSAVDTNADGHPDVLRVEVGVTLDAPADVTLRGTLVDATGAGLVSATTSAALAAGGGTLVLDLDGGVLGARGVDGPYTLTGVELGRTGEAPDVLALGVHTTAAYDADAFRAGGGLVIETVADRGVDIDGDGLFEQFAVDVTVDVQEEDLYSVNGRLTDAAGEEIQWKGSTVLLQPGEGVLTLLYDGRLVSGRGVDGPYRVESLTVYADPTSPVTLREPYPTAAYTWQQFEQGVAVVGHVLSDGAPVEGVAVAVPGLAYDVTDAAGTYRLALPGGGSYEVVLAADAALAPWRILVDGAQQATGTRVGVTLADGSTTRVDFERGDDASVTEYLTRVYRDLLGRDPDPHGLQSWSDALRRGVPYAEVVGGITAGVEYRGRAIRESYERYLDREADHVGLETWLAATGAGLQLLDLHALLVSSAEFRAGSDDREWVADVYGAVLERVPSTAEVDHWQGVLAQGTSHADVARYFLHSPEHLTAVVEGLYVEFLRRPTDPTGRATWVAALQAGVRLETVVAALVSSAEYRAGTAT